MAPGRSRDEFKERQWRRWINEWRDSGLSVLAYCSRRGLNSSNFYAWRRTLERRAAEQAAFVPVHILTDTSPGPASALELVLTDGRTVRVPPGFDASSLRQLLAVLREQPPC